MRSGMIKITAVCAGVCQCLPVSVHGGEQSGAAVPALAWQSTAFASLKSRRF